MRPTPGMRPPIWLNACWATVASCCTRCNASSSNRSCCLAAHARRWLPSTEPPLSPALPVPPAEKLAPLNTTRSVAVGILATLESPQSGQQQVLPALERCTARFGAVDRPVDPAGRGSERRRLVSLALLAVGVDAGAGLDQARSAPTGDARGPKGGPLGADKPLGRPDARVGIGLGGQLDLLTGHAVVDATHCTGEQRPGECVGKAQCCPQQVHRPGVLL